MDYAKSSIKIQQEKERLNRFYEILLEADIKVLRDLVEEKRRNNRRLELRKE